MMSIRPIPGSATTALLIIVWAALGAAQDSRLDVPQWRGRDRDGAASGFVEPATWPKELTRRWKVEVGAGYASPIVVDGHVYTFTRQEGKETCSAIDASDGRILWRTGYDVTYEAAPAAAVHGIGPKATPLFFAGKIFSLGISGILSAFDAKTGRLVWKTPAPKEAPYFSAASSPVGIDGLVIAHPGDYGPLTAFDAETGTIKWTAGEDGFFASPIVIEASGVRQVVTVTQKDVIGVASKTGDVLWRYPFVNSGATTPVFHDGRVIVGGLNVGVTAITPIEEDGKWVARKAWDTTDGAMYLSTPVVIAGTLFGFSHRNSGQFFAMDASSGKMLWQGAPREAAHASIARSGNTLFLLKDDGTLIVARNSPQGLVPVVRYTVAEAATWAFPAISGDRIFIKDVRSLTLWSIAR